MNEAQISQLKQIIAQTQSNSDVMTEINKAGGNIPVSVIDSNNSIVAGLIKFIEADEGTRAIAN